MPVNSRLQAIYLDRKSKDNILLADNSRAQLCEERTIDIDILVISRNGDKPLEETKLATF